MPEPTQTSPHRGERVIAYMIAAMVIMSIVSFFVILGGAYFGNSGYFDQGVWPVVALIPLIALPLAFVLVIALFAVGIRRRSKSVAEAALTRPQRTTAAPARSFSAKVAPQRPRAK